MQFEQQSAIRVPQSAIVRCLFWLLSVILVPVVGAATIDKTNNADALNLGSSWVGGVVPTAADVAQWSAIVTNANTVNLGANTNWLGLKLTSPGGNVVINGANTLTLGTSGIDLSAATRDLTLNCPLTLAGSQTWNIIGGRALTNSANVSGSGMTLSKEGTGTNVVLSGTFTLQKLAVNTGRFLVKGGTLTVSGGTGAYDSIVVSTDGILEQTGGTVSTPNYLTVGQSTSGGTPQATFSGGSFSSGLDFLIGYAQNGILNVSGSANVTVGNNLRFGQAANATVNLNGGTLTADSLSTGGGSSASVVNLNGGKLRASSAPVTPWWPVISGLTAYVKSGGAVFDDNGQSITINQPLLDGTGGGGLTKTGSGTLTLTATNTFTGPTVVSTGTLIVSGRLSGTTNVTVNSGAKLTGTGVISGAVTIRDGATLDVGPSALTTGSLILSNTSVLDLAIGSANGGTNAVVRVNGNLVLDGQLLVSDAGGLTAGQSYAAFYYTGNLTNNGLTLHPLSAWEVSVDTNTARVVKLLMVRKFPFLEFTNAPATVTALSTNLNVILHGITTNAIWYEVRDATNRLWDYGAHPPSAPWDCTMRHLREGTNTVTVFARPTTGGIASNSVQLILTLSSNTLVRPRPVPAEIWWGGSCHYNLYDTNSNIIGTHSNMEQLTNTVGWDYVKRWHDGFMLHGYVWVNGVAKMTNRSTVGPAISAQLTPLNTRFILEDAWRPQTNNMNYGHSSATGQSGNAALLEGLGFTLSDVTQDYNPQYQDFSQWHPEWPTNNLRVAGTGNTNEISAGYPYTSGQWRDYVTDYQPLRPHVKVGWTWSPVWFSWSNGVSLGTDPGIFNFTNNGTNYSFKWNFYDFMKDAWLVGTSLGSPFAFVSDCPYEYFAEYPGNPGGWSLAQLAANRKKIRDYEAWLWSRGSRHTQICNSYDGGSSNNDTWDLNYKNQSLTVMRTHQQEGGRATRYLFESWYAGPYAVLPETKSGSYANLAMDAIKYIKGIRDTNGTPEDLSFTLLNTGAVVTVQLRNDGDIQCLPVIQAFESGAGGTAVKYYDSAGRDITSAILSAEGFAVTNFLATGAVTTISVAVQGTPAALSKTVTLEAFWNPQDPTGLVRDRVSLVLPPPQAPFNGTPEVLPGTIQAEDYDLGGEGVGYHDTTLTNVSGQYRPLDGVDIETCSDTGGGYSLGNVLAGEWLEYTVNALYPGQYQLEVRTASSGNGGTFHLEVDGVNVSGFLTVSNTGGWQTWQTLTRTNAAITAGQHVLRLAMDTNGATGYVGNFNWMRFTFIDANNPVRAYVWTNAAGGVWSGAGNWSNAVAPPVGGNSNGTVRFAAGGAYSASNNLAGAFALNSLEAANPSNAAVTVVSGGSLRFVNQTTTLALPQLNQSSAGACVISNPVTLLSDLTLNASSTAPVTFASEISGAGGLVKNGNNTVILTASNSFTGLTRVLSGTLQVGNGITNGSLAGDITNNATLDFIVLTNTTVTQPGDISGTGGLIKDGFGTLILSGSNTFAGDLNVKTGAVWITSSYGLGVGTKSIYLNNGSPGHPELHLDGSLGSVVLPSSIAFFTSWAGGCLFNEAGDNVIQGNVTLTGGGGDTVIYSKAGTLTLTGTFAPSTTGRNLRFYGPGAGLVSGTIADGGTNMLAVAVAGGMWTFSGTNTYSLTTSVQGGSLWVNGALSGTGAVSVAANAVLGGNGLIRGPVTVNGGGQLTPGDTDCGTLTISNALTFAANSTNLMRLAKALGTNDQVAGLGKVTYGGTLVITNLGGILAAGDRFKLFSATNYTGTFAKTNLPALRPGLTWTNKLLLDGSLEIIGAAAPLQIVKPALIGAGQNLSLSGSGGQPGTVYYLLAATNITTPGSNWVPVLTNTFDTNGGFSATNTINRTVPRRFLRLQMQ
ncbi:MAG: carbohydrate-binding protein [Verrucomicrobiota bacterium]